MKKPLTALLAAGLATALLLAACGQTPASSSAPPAPAPAPSSQSLVDIGDDPVPGPTSLPDFSEPTVPDTVGLHVEMQAQYADGRNLIEVPYIALADGASNPETAEMNTAITAFANCQDVDYGGTFSDYINGDMGDEWMELRAFVIEDEDSVQVILRRELLPAAASAGDLFSLVYSRELGRLVTVEDALQAEGVATEALAGMVPGLMDGETVASVSVPAFYVGGGVATFFVVADIESTVSQPGTRLYAYTPTTGDFVQVLDHTHLVPAEYLTSFEPPLAWESA
ncbi:MAG: hypothetical protein GXY32_10330 [Ruminococcaceae bacterium]|nr:hypothetical protein [Oscillospiraceae bacterium]